MTTEERRWTLSRLAEVGARVDALPDLTVTTTEIAKMLIGLSVQRMDEAEAAAKVALYVEAVDDVPTWAVIAARKAWNRADRRLYPDGRFAFPPSPAQLSEAARSLLREAEGEVARLRRILDAKVLPPLEYRSDTPKWEPPPPPPAPNQVRVVKAKVRAMPKAPDPNKVTLPPAELALVNMMRDGIPVTQEMIDLAEEAST